VPVELAGRIDGLPLRGLTVDMPVLALTANPGETVELAVHVQFGETIAFEHLAQTLLTAKLKTVGEERILSAEKTVPVIIDRSYALPVVAAVSLDGSMEEWSGLPLTTGEKPLVLGPAEQWQGAEDAALAFSLGQDEQTVYLAARVTDDAVTSADGLELRLDTRPIDQRKADAALSRDTFLFHVAAPNTAGETTVEATSPDGALHEGVRIAGRRTAAGYEIELAIPRELLAQAQAGALTSLQAAAALIDSDADGETPCRILWRATADIDQRNTNYGQFVPAP